MPTKKEIDDIRKSMEKVKEIVETPEDKTTMEKFIKGFDTVVNKYLKGNDNISSKGE